MKILLVSDLHYALKQFDWTLAVAESFDLVVIAGDHIDVCGQLDGGVQVVVILKYLKRLAERTKLIVSSGNHDLDRRDEAGEKIASWVNKVRLLGVPTDGEAVMLGDTLITVCPWWDGPIAKRSVEAQFERGAAAAKKSWIWVYHSPPEGSPTAWNGRRCFGDAALTEWIGSYQPDMVLTGHVHEAPFKREGSWVDRIGKSWVFNCGRQIGSVPAHIAIDTEERAAAWFSIAGAELVSLNASLARTELTGPPPWLQLANPVLGQSLA